MHIIWNFDTKIYMNSFIIISNSAGSLTQNVCFLGAIWHKMYLNRYDKCYNNKQSSCF